MPVKNQLLAQRGALERRAKRSTRKAPSAEELRRLEKEGDTSCPRGQAYRPLEGVDPARKADAKEIRCTGPQIAEMTADQVTKYFDELGYRVTRPLPERVVAERGAERATFIYANAAGQVRPHCVIVAPAPDIPWLEALARTTGANPARIKSPTGTVRLAQGELPYTVDEKHVLIRIGDCRSD